VLWVFLLGIPVVLLRDRLGLTGTAATLLVFVLSALSLIPLAGFVESAVEELAELLGQFVGGLLHTTFGNAAELIIGISILTHSATITNATEIVRASIAGSVIRNSLLFLGVATILGCWRNGRMKFSAENASEYSTVFALAVIGLALPTMAHLLNFPAFGEGQALRPSLALAVILVVSYLAYVLFAVFRVAEGRDLVAARRQRREERAARAAARRRARQRARLPLPAPLDVNALFAEERASAEARLALEAADAAALAPASQTRRRIDPRGLRMQAEREARRAAGEKESGLLALHPALRGLIAAVVLAAAAFGVVVMSEQFVGTIEPVATHFLNGNELFVGLIVIPVIGGVVELTGAVSTARHNRMEITMAVTAGASIQMILLVAPVLVFVGALVGASFDLVFQPLALAVFIASSFVFMLLSRDGESSWLEGVQLVSIWVLVASTAFFL
jgi:Ca2+:H+ antiporter